MIIGPIPCYQSLISFDIESDGTVGTLAVPGELGAHETLSKQAFVYAISNDIILV